jgi:hypothetical protein
MVYTIVSCISVILLFDTKLQVMAGGGNTEKSVIYEGL